MMARLTPDQRKILEHLDAMEDNARSIGVYVGCQWPGYGHSWAEPRLRTLTKRGLVRELRTYPPPIIYAITDDGRDALARRKEVQK